MPVAHALQIDVHLGPAELAAALRADALAGLTARPKELPCKWFYDERGCALYEAITHLPEYYLTRREGEILMEHCDEVASLTQAETLIELGSGSSEKTRLLLTALTATGRLRRFVPFDVSEPTLRDAGRSITTEYRGIQVHGIVGDFESHLDRLRALLDGGRRLVAFLGSTIGNLTPRRRERFLSEIASGLEPGDALLLGADLVKDESRLAAAYNDATGVTAEFNRNVLAVLNRELGADFVTHQFEHIAPFDPENEWIEMRLRSVVDQQVNLPGIGLRVHFREGEEMRTEISAKFRRTGVEAELTAVGLEPAGWWTDPAGDFSLSLAFRR